MHEQRQETAMVEHKEGKLELIAVQQFAPYDEMYKVVDFLNKHLKHKKIMFGLTKHKSSGQMVISVYEVE
ncbi:MAG: YpmA family protein [Bacillota bacterium]|uniref:YpmA family protein n=1 Tax=Desulfurispora thermophila TaxID=265470 RepID=UPI0003720D7A|nr:YpmA family protein [Desulfurispora thermophila]